MQVAEQQRRLIDAAAGLLKPGGHMVYSTCTINPGEKKKRPSMGSTTSAACCPSHEALHRALMAELAVLIGRQCGQSSACHDLTGENEANVRYALDAHPALELVPHKPYIGGPGLAGPCESAAAGLSTPAPGVASAAAAAAAAPATAGQLAGRGLSAAEARLVQRFDPAGPRDTPGFFIAKFRKRC